MESKIYPDYDAMSAAAASLIIDCVRKKPAALLCFATGDTPRLTYQKLVEMAAEEEVDFSKVFIVGLDEWLGIPPDNSGSCQYFLRHYLLDPLKIKPSQIHLFDALSTDPAAECEKMNGVIAEKGPVDFMVVGVGMNGHIGFNEPGTDPNSVAHVAALDNTTKTVGQKYFEQEVAISQGITLGLKQVFEANTMLMIANGKKKAPVIQRTLEGEISTEFPASLIRQNKNSILMIDSEAAQELKTKAK